MEFKLPDIGEGVHEGEVVKWLVKAGDSIQVDQPLVEIMTDKATVELPAPFVGMIETINAKEGEVVKVGQVILTYAEGAGKKAEPAPQSPKEEKKSVEQKPTSAPQKGVPAAPAAEQSQPTQPAHAPEAANGDKEETSIPVLASPVTRRLAQDLGVRLSEVPATGPHGRVTKEDVQKFSSQGTARGTASSFAPVAFQKNQERETVIPFRGIRRKISEAMSRSRTVIPEFNYIDEVDVSELVAFRQEAKALAEKRGVKLTYLPFIIKAMIRGLKEFPSLNATLDEENGQIIVKNYYNIGIAVDTDDGLVVPNVKNADQKTILEIAKEIQTLAEKARAKKLALEEMQGATITITNPGPIGGLITTPVINWPEVAIMGVHKIVRRPVVQKDQIEIADMMYLSLAVDHRVVDGASAARFVNVCIEYLSQPKKLMLDMF